MKRLIPLTALLCAALLLMPPALAGSLSTAGPRNMEVLSNTPEPAAPTAPPATDMPVIVVSATEAPVLPTLPEEQPDLPTPTPIVMEISLDEETPAPAAAQEPQGKAAGGLDFPGYVKAHWPVLAAVVGGVVLLVALLALLTRVKGRKRRLRDPDAYGAYIAAWLSRRGFAEVSTVGPTADGVLITCRAPRGTKVAVLCVLSGGAVSYRTVQQADEEKDRCGCPKAAVVTNGTFSRQAVEGARALNIELMAGIE